MKEEISARLSALRKQMHDAGIAATIVPQADPHQGEYLADHWQVRRYFSGFTGSAGDLVVTADKALLWTDSRYFLQASQQLEGTEIVLMKDGLPDTPSIAGWLGTNLRKGDTVGIDGLLFSVKAADELAAKLNAEGINVNFSFDPAKTWVGRPDLPLDEIFVHDIKYAGVAAAAKIAAALDRAHRREHADAVFVSALDEIAWILNIRANDVECNPVATSFLYIADKGTILFTDLRKVNDGVREYLASQGVAVKPYADVISFLKTVPAEISVLVDGSRTARGIVEAIPTALVGGSVIAFAKSCKNDVQIAGVHDAMRRDGVALVKSFIEIERRANGEGEPLTELSVCEILRRNRSAQSLFFDESFGTIAGYGPHGAIVHYSPTKESDVVIRTGNLLLIDSGAQYQDGTTDITRTISIGKPTAEQKHDFTLVMKGHIALGTAVFPEGTTGHQLDVLARQFLWKEGLSYLHGTGHGVGHFLNVHEGPQSIRLNHVPAPLMPGMITSNEPGLYRAGIHGIRCENLVLTVPAMASAEFGKFYRFETLTLFPFDLSLFETEIMTDAEIRWVNDYHAKVREALMPGLDTDEERQWLEARTATLTR